MLLAIDVGNTETVIGLFALDDENDPSPDTLAGGLGIGALDGPSPGGSPITGVSRPCPRARPTSTR